jgi:hypothetical protein
MPMADDRTHQTQGGQQQRQRHQTLARHVIAGQIDHRTGTTGLQHHDSRQSHGGDHGATVRLEQVRAHASHVTDVVADIVSDHARVAWVVLRDTGLDLAHQIGPHIGGLCKDAAADTIEQGDHACAHGEAVDVVRGLWIGAEDQVQGPKTQQTKRGEHQTHDGAAEKCNSQCCVLAFLMGGRGGPHVGAGGGHHAEEAGGSRAKSADQEGYGRFDSEVRDGQGDEEHRHRDADQDQLPPHEGHGALLDQAGDLRGLTFHHRIVHHNAEDDEGHDKADNPENRGDHQLVHFFSQRTGELFSIISQAGLVG